MIVVPAEAGTQALGPRLHGGDSQAALRCHAFGRVKVSIP
jgi:hypothetical protein